jgi:chromate transporter
LIVVSRVIEVLLVALKLGVTSFGGPVAHIGYFRDEYVTRRRWLDEGSYADLVALCQLLPGPASSQVGIAVGTRRAGLGGGVAAWLGFTLPSAAALILFGYGVATFEHLVTAGWLRGLKVVAAAVVAFAVYGMAQNLAPDRQRASIAALAAIGMLFWRTPLAQVLVIALAGGVGSLLLQDTGRSPDAPPRSSAAGATRTVICLALFLILLIGLPVVRQFTDNGWLEVFDGFYRSGALVFGGGHVVLPLLQAEVVPVGWVTGDQFIAGYGVAQAVPGPLFTFSAYLGTVMEGGPPGGWSGGLFALGAIFLPSFLLVIGILPLWDRLRSVSRFRAAIAGVNAAVVGLLLAALYDPVWITAIHAPSDVALGLAAFGMLAWWKLPPWLVVLLGAATGAALTAL